MALPELVAFEIELGAAGPPPPGGNEMPVIEISGNLSNSVGILESVAIAASGFVHASFAGGSYPRGTRVLMLRPVGGVVNIQKAAASTEFIPLDSANNDLGKQNVDGSGAKELYAALQGAATLQAFALG